MFGVVKRTRDSGAHILVWGVQSTSRILHASIFVISVNFSKNISNSNTWECINNKFLKKTRMGLPVDSW